jgi:acyl carrier protein
VHRLQGVPSMTRDAVRTAVAEAICELTGTAVEKIADTDDLVKDLGVDSMTSVNLLVAIEDRVGARVPDGAEGSLVGIRTVGDLVDRLIAVFALEAADAPAASLG